MTEKPQSEQSLDSSLDEALEMTFPASDPTAVHSPGGGGGGGRAFTGPHPPPPTHVLMPALVRFGAFWLVP
jgi:hypothetical protein